MTYKIDGVDINTFGAYPYVENSKECIAVSGVFDLPKRIGATEYNWGTSIEPYVDEEDIELDGRNITLSLAIKAHDYKAKLAALKSACIACKKLYTDFEEFDVVLKGEINIDEWVGLNMAVIDIKFWQQNYNIATLSTTTTGGTEYLLDGYNLYKDFGICVSSRKNIESVAKRIEISTTKPYTKSDYREVRDITLSCMMKGNNIRELYTKMNQFNSLCISPGIRVLTLRENETIQLYFKDGITVTPRSEKLLDFTLKCRVCH